MSDRENIPHRRNNLLVFASIIVFLLTIAVSLVIKFSPQDPLFPISPSHITNSSTQTPIPKDTQFSMSTTGGLSVAFTFAPLSTTTPLLVPTAFRGVVGPDGFIVVKWRDDSCDRSRNNNTLNISGVVISGVVKPQEFTFQQSGQTFIRSLPIATPSGTFHPSDPDSALGEVIIFDEPVRLDKDKYAHVIINFRSEDGKIPWVDDLLYLSQNPDCPNN